MKIQVKSESLKDAVKSLIGIKPQTDVMDVLKFVKLETTSDDHNFETVSLTATDLDVSKRIEIRPESVKESGVVLIALQKLYNILNKVPSGAILTVSDASSETDNTSTVVLEGDNFHYTLVSPRLDDYPNVAFSDIASSFEHSISINSAYVYDIFHRTYLHIPKCHPRPTLCGGCFKRQDGKQYFFGTDGHRLLINVLDNSIWDIPEGKNFVVSKSAMVEIMKICSETDVLTLNFDSKMLYIDGGVVSFSTRLLDGNYPEVLCVEPDSFSNSVRFRKSDFLSALNIVSSILTRNEVACAVSFLPEDSIAVLKSASVNVGECEYTVPINPINIKHNQSITLNCYYLIDCLSRVSSPEIVMEFDDAVSPVRMSSNSDDSWRYLVMPIREAL